MLQPELSLTTFLPVYAFALRIAQKKTRLIKSRVGKKNNQQIINDNLCCYQKTVLRPNIMQVYLPDLIFYDCAEKRTRQLQQAQHTAEYQSSSL